MAKNSKEREQNENYMELRSNFDELYVDYLTFKVCMMEPENIGPKMVLESNVEGDKSFLKISFLSSM